MWSQQIPNFRHTYTDRRTQIHAGEIYIPSEIFASSSPDADIYGTRVQYTSTHV